MILSIKDFPEELRWKLRVKADEAGVTLRKLLIGVLAEWCESDREVRGDGLREAGGDKRAAGVSGVRGGVLDGKGQKRAAEAERASDGTSAHDGAVDRGLRKDQRKEIEDILGEPEW